MRVNYNGFTGELMKLEREAGMIGLTDDGSVYSRVSYALFIYDSEKQVTHSFTGVNLEDVKFLGGTVVFGG